MSLKDQMAADLEDGGVWFNTLDFAEEHDINGTRVLCIMDSPQAKPVPIGRNTGGAFTGSSFISVRARDFARRPNPGESIAIDGKKYIIKAVTEDMGVYVIFYGGVDDDKRVGPDRRG